MANGLCRPHLKGREISLDPRAAQGKLNTASHFIQIVNRKEKSDLSLDTFTFPIS